MFFINELRKSNVENICFLLKKTLLQIVVYYFILKIKNDFLFPSY
jgi:hypothetical protein